jgi:H/ACA ribonucleoprotein complex subunit 2
VASKEELGNAASTKRPTSCVMICPGMKKRKPKEIEGVVEMEEDSKENDEEYEEMLKGVEDEVYSTVSSSFPARV